MKHSYTAADVDVPVKLIHDHRLMKGISEAKFILLRHLQLCPTNRCNLNCSFCSCGDREKSIEMPLVQVMDLLYTAKGCGCEAITITGGGEPLMHPDINLIIKACYDKGIKVGLVTNGLLLDKLTERVDWLRVSFDSGRDFKVLSTVLNRAVKRILTDWAFSFVAYEGVGQLKKLVKYANANRFTHVRVVADINNPSDDVIMSCRSLLAGVDKKVIYQPRTRPTAGQKKCWISLLKPTIAADGTIYPCCGAQYALKDTRDFHKALSMGKDLKEVITKQLVFDGSVCDKCYYSNYNKFIDLVMENVEHKLWV
jgi:MoaA/NifB/PqqE/SkfB family radical SAM enzyme